MEFQYYRRPEFVLQVPLSVPSFTMFSMLFCAKEFVDQHNDWSVQCGVHGLLPDFARYGVPPGIEVG